MSKATRIGPDSWPEEAACAAPGIYPFFDSIAPGDIAIAKRICAHCPVTAYCRTYCEAIEPYLPKDPRTFKQYYEHVYAGETPEERYWRRTQEKHEREAA